jgi:hypothetical protein
MPTLTFEGDSHGELVAQVRQWLNSLDENSEGTMSVSDAIAQGAGLTKDALRVIAAAAPAPVAQNDVVKALTDMGYKATDATSKAMVDGLKSVEALTGGSIIEQVSDKGRSTLWSMNQKVAKQVLRTLSGT